MTQPDPRAHPIVEPTRDFEPIRLEDATFSSAPRTIIRDPLKRFILDRFKTMTTRQAVNFLADIDMQILEQHRADPRPPFQFTLMVEKLRLGSVDEITSAHAVAFYENYSQSRQQAWIERLLKNEETKQILKERTYDFLATQLPAIGYTLAHIFEGGYIGLLTARGARSNHAPQIQLINETLAFSSQLDLIYYVNDDDLGKRLGPTGKQSAQKKALVLMNFINGFKEDAEGNWVPMKLGRPFDEIIFIDDEDKNLKAVMECLVRDVCSNVLYEAGITHRTAVIEQRITERAQSITETTFAAERLKPLENFGFWLGVVDELLKEFTAHTGRLQDREALIRDLIAHKKWLPDKLKVYDGNDIPFDKVRARLDAVLESGEPLELGSKKSIVFNDIDGNLVWVPAKFYVHRRSDPEATPLLVLSQAEFADNPSIDFWIRTASQTQSIDVEDLQFSFAHFEDPKFIEEDILRASFEGETSRGASFRSKQH